MGNKLYFRYGAMGSGKTTFLLQTIYNYEQKGMKVLVLKPQIDTKGGKTIVSRINLQREVDYLLNQGDLIEPLLKKHKYHAILVDEAQFLTRNQVDELYKITKQKEIPVLCYGLRCDFMLHGFPGSTRLLELADDIEELKTICRCGIKASINARKVNDEFVFKGNQVAIDGEGSVTYEALCGKCYFEEKNKSCKDN